MKFIIFTLLIFQSAFALDIETKWTPDTKKYLHLTCNGNSECEKFCDGNYCKMQERVCKNCVSSSIEMTYAFQEMGRSYIRGERLDDYFIFDLFYTRRFITLTSRSIYNLIERFDSLSLRRRFQALCNDDTKYPVVFFKQNEAGKLGEVQAVWCEDGIYEVNQLEFHDLDTTIPLT